MNDSQLALRRSQLYRFLADALLYPTEDWMCDVPLLEPALDELHLSHYRLCGSAIDLADLQAEHRRVFGLTGSLCYETEYGLPHEYRQSQEMADIAGFYRAFGFQNVITQRHIDNMCKVMLATGLMVTYGYVMEHFIAWYSGSELELFAFLNRWQGHYRAIWYVQLFCNVLSPQIFWFRWARRSEVVLFVVSILINVGMWAERFVIIAVSLTRDFVPSSWANYAPTWVDWGLLFGSICTFGALFLLFLRFLPAIPLFEVKELRRELEHHDAHANAHHAAGAGEGRP